MLSLNDLSVLTPGVLRVTVANTEDPEVVRVSFALPGGLEYECRVYGWELQAALENCWNATKVRVSDEDSAE